MVLASAVEGVMSAAELPTISVGIRAEARRLRMTSVTGAHLPIDPPPLAVIIEEAMSYLALCSRLPSPAINRKTIPVCRIWRRCFLAAELDPIHDGALAAISTTSRVQAIVDPPTGVGPLPSCYFLEIVASP
jgi:hypothetical protein